MFKNDTPPINEYFYYELCKVAIDQNPLALEFVNIDTTTTKHYAICFDASIRDPMSLQFIHDIFMRDKLRDFITILSK